MRTGAGRIGATAAAAVLVVLGAGCGGGGSTSEDSTGPSSGEPTTVESTGTQPPPASNPSTTSDSDGTPPATDSVTTGAPASTQAPPTTLAADLGAVSVSLTEVWSFDEPITMAIRPGDDQTVYIGERGGTVRAVSDEDDVELLDIADDTEATGERGLLGLAISPDGSFLYVSSTRDDGTSAIDEYPFSPDGTIDPSARRIVSEIEQPYANHNGGNIVFGPDGFLYVGMGDGGSADDPERRALDLGSLLGKMLRIDPTTPSGDLGYTIPGDNPFVEDPSARGEIWSIGWRNPWRYSFDRVTGDLWVGDVGQGEWEEIDVAPATARAGAGLSFGWSAFEGTHRLNEDQPETGHQPPIHEYSHSSGDGNSVTGGFVYRGSAIPALYGAYVFGDYESGNIWAITADSDGSLADGPVLIAETEALASFGEDATGELFVLSLNGPVYRLDP